MNASSKALGIALALTSLLFIALGQGSIASTDDALYAQMAREMAAAGHWLTASWLGVEVFEKPPLLLWLLRIFGPPLGWSEFSLRLPGVLGAGIALYYLVRLVQADTSSWAASAVAGIVTLATVTFTLNARRPMTDPLLCAAVMATLFYTWRLIAAPQRGAALALGIAGGLGILAKWVAMGPVALVSALALIRARRSRHLAQASGVALLVAAPWFLLMSTKHGAEFWEVFLGYHVVARAGDSLVGVESITFYIDTLWQLDGAFGVLMLLALLLAPWLKPTRVSWLSCGTGLLTLAIIHLSSTRLYHYLMPVIPLAALALTLTASRSRVALVGLGLVASIAFVVGPLEPTLTRPNFAPSSKTLGLSLRGLDEDATIISWEDYDPALIWYAERPIQIWTQSEAMANAQNSVDMMRRTKAVTLATPERLEALGKREELIFIVAPRERAQGLLHWMQRQTHRSVALDAESSASHLLVRLGPMR